MSVHTSETNVPFLVVSYFLLNPAATLDCNDIERRFGMPAKNSAANLKTAVLNGLIAKEKRGRAHIYRAGEALTRVRARVEA